MGIFRTSFDRVKKNDFFLCRYQINGWYLRGKVKIYSKIVFLTFIYIVLIKSFGIKEVM